VSEKHFTGKMAPLLPEILEDDLKRSRSPSPLRSFILTIGMVLTISCATSLPASAETSDNALETVPLPLSGTISLFSTTTSTEGEKKPLQVPFKQEDMIRLGPAGPTFLDTLQAGITKNILQSSLWLDSFFYDPRYAAEENETRAIVRYEGFIEDHAHWTFKTRVKFVLILPQLKKKANLFITGDTDEDNPSQLGQGLLTSPAPNQNTDRNRTAALGYLIKSGERLNISAKIGIRYRNGQMVSFIRPHYRMLYRLDNWDLRFTQEFPYWTDAKWSSSTTVDLERPLGDTFFFRASLNGSWYEKQPGYYYGLAFSLSQPLSTTSALSYDLGASFQTGAHDVLQTVVVATRYRQRFWRDWLYFDIAPQVRFPRDRQFNAVPGILFGLEMQFGQGR
jgi:hypothetical protein